MKQLMRNNSKLIWIKWYIRAISLFLLGQEIILQLQDMEKIKYWQQPFKPITQINISNLLLEELKMNLKGNMRLLNRKLPLNNYIKKL